MARRTPYPLSAIVGQEDLVEALLVCAVHRAVGGVLVRGERGTAKSTAVRALAPMLGSAGGMVSTTQPASLARGAKAVRPIAPVAAPLVELPLGATLDRLVGTLDLKAALGGEHRVEEGLLGRANGGLLYVDEVNLLPDHLVDALLDAAASGEVTVERDGVSVVQDASFILVGTMNPEEGELRPQLLDRFGLGVEVTGPREPAIRADIVRRRMAFDRNPEAFTRLYESKEQALASRIAAARKLIASVTVPERELLRITTVCAKLDLDGVRGDLVCAETARALAALEGVDEVTSQHVERAAHLALRHRMRRDPLAPPPGEGRDPGIDEALEGAADDLPDDGGSDLRVHDEPGDSPSESQSDPRDQAEPPNPEPLPQPETEASTPAPAPAPSWSPSPELERPSRPPAEPSQAQPPRSVRPPSLPARVPESALTLSRVARSVTKTDPSVLVPSGRSPGGQLAVLDSRPANPDDAVAILPTVLAALRGDRRPQTAITGGGRGALLVLIVDTSGSMGTQKRLARVKGAIEAALRRAYARRDLVAVVGFGGEGARTIVEPGMPLEFAAAATRDLPAGGRTPLAAGIAHGAELVERAGNGRLAGRARIAVLLTDGRATDREGHARAALARLVVAADRTVVVDLEEGRVRLGLAAQLAAAAGADLTRLITPESEFQRPGRSAA